MEYVVAAIYRVKCGIHGTYWIFFCWSNIVYYHKFINIDAVVTTATPLITIWRKQDRPPLEAISGGPKEKVTRCSLVDHKNFSLKNGVSHTMLDMKNTKKIILQPPAGSLWVHPWKQLLKTMFKYYSTDNKLG
jgi:hypothetical protein